MMNRKAEIEYLCKALVKEPEVKRIVAIDMIKLLEHINNAPPDNLSRLNSIILNQRQYEITVIDEEC